MSRTVRALAAALLLAATVARAGGSGDVLWKDNDDLPVAAPREDHDGDYIWWDGVRNMALRPAGAVLDLGRLGRTLGEWAHLVGPREAINVNALDEVPDSSWFSNRHARRRLAPSDLGRGAVHGLPPADDGPLTILSGKALGMTPGYVVRDRKGDHYVVKFDPAEYPEVATGAEMVCSRIVFALGWNVPQYDLVLVAPERFEIGPGATVKGESGSKVALTPERLARDLARAHHVADGRVRTIASRFIDGVPLGSPPLVGVRGDDPNDTVRHENRRDLRGLRIVAALLNYTDARRGNFYDTFVPDSPEQGSAGHVVHYVLDFSSALGAGNVDWKDPKLGHEYLFDPPKVLGRALTLWTIPPAWAGLPLTHPALGYFESSTFDPAEWRPSYANPAFQAATVLDSFWGAKLVASLRDEDLSTAAAAGGWSDPRAAELLVRILADRRRRIARTYFDSRRVNPVDHFTVDGGALRFADLAVVSDVVDASVVRYRLRSGGGPWQVVREPRAPLDAASSADGVELQTSHDLGEHWSPTTRVRVASPDGRPQIVGIEREAD